MRLKRNGYVISLLVFVNMCILINVLNPTLLPEQLRFAATCTRTSEKVALQNKLHVHKYKFPERIVRNYAEFNDHSWMPRFLDMDTHRKAIDLLKSIDSIFHKHDVTYTLIHGTLLGSYIFHDLIPWDDDLDIVVSFRDVNKVRAIFRLPVITNDFGAVSYHDELDIYNEPFISADVKTEDPSYCGPHADLQGRSCMHKFHFYRKDSEKTLRRDIGYPYIDVKFYTENDTHIWTMDDALNSVIHEKNDFYPLHYRPLFDSWLPVPHQTRRILRHKFREFKCASKWYSHHTQTIAMGYEVGCQHIADCYPYVRRMSPCIAPDCDPMPSGVNEQLVIDDTVIHEVFIDEPFYGLQPFQI